MKKFTAILLAAIMTFAMAACGTNSEPSSGTDASNQDAMISVTIEVDYPDDSNVADVDDFSLQVPEGASALDVLNQYATESNTKVEMSDSSATAYVTAINGVAEASDAGWVYELNDKTVMKAADQCIVKAGDEISWEYTSWDDMND